jgi:hypothetical protein
LIGFKKDFEVFCKMKDEVLLGGKDVNREKCFSCGQYNHSFVSCPLIFFAPKKNQIIYKEINNPM